MIQVNSLTYCYPKASTPVINNMSLELKPGMIYGLLGSNGAGKSTFLYLVSGLLKPAFGEILINGKASWERTPALLSDMFLVPEEFSLPSVNLKDFISVNAPFYPSFSIEQMEAYLREFGMESDVHLGRLSMGQRNKVFIAFALACNTSLLLMDEPTNGLDIPGKSEFRRILVSAMDSKRTVIISTHQVRDLDRVIDSVVMMDKGGVVLNASIEAIQSRLCFDLSARPNDGALYCEAVPGGYSIVRLNTGEEETAVNLESLFELTLSKPNVINQLFKDEQR